MVIERLMNHVPRLVNEAKDCQLFQHNRIQLSAEDESWKSRPAIRPLSPSIGHTEDQSSTATTTAHVEELRVGFDYSSVGSAEIRAPLAMAFDRLYPTSHFCLYDCYY